MKRNVPGLLCDFAHGARQIPQRIKNKQDMRECALDVNSIGSFVFLRENAEGG